MKENLRNPKESEEVSGSELTRFQTTMRSRDIYFQLADELTELLGPLTVRERWILLGEYGLENFRRLVSLEGAALETAQRIINVASKLGYPADVLILQLIQDLASVPDQLAADLDQLLEPAE